LNKHRNHLIKATIKSNSIAVTSLFGKNGSTTHCKTMT
jgi:hypothetical protein